MSPVSIPVAFEVSMGVPIDQLHTLPISICVSEPPPERTNHFVEPVRT